MSKDLSSEGMAAFPVRQRFSLTNRFLVRHPNIVSSYLWRHLFCHRIYKGSGYGDLAPTRALGDAIGEQCWKLTYAIRAVNLRLGCCGVRHGSVVARITRSIESNESTHLLLEIRVPRVVPSTSVLRTPHHNQPSTMTRNPEQEIGGNGYHQEVIVRRRQYSAKATVCNTIRLSVVRTSVRRSSRTSRELRKEQASAGRTANSRTSVLFVVSTVNNNQYTQSSVLRSSPTHPWHGLPEVLSRMSRLIYF
jgi:hypothetical protein